MCRNEKQRTAPLSSHSTVFCYQHILGDKRRHLDQYYVLYLQLNVKLCCKASSLCIFDATNASFSNCIQFTR